MTLGPLGLGWRCSQPVNSLRFVSLVFCSVVGLVSKGFHGQVESTESVDERIQRCGGVAEYHVGGWCQGRLSVADISGPFIFFIEMMLRDTGLETSLRSLFMLCQAFNIHITSVTLRSKVATVFRLGFLGVCSADDLSICTMPQTLFYCIWPADLTCESMAAGSSSGFVIKSATPWLCGKLWHVHVIGY